MTAPTYKRKTITNRPIDVSSQVTWLFKRAE